MNGDSHTLTGHTTIKAGTSLYLLVDSQIINFRRVFTILPVIVFEDTPVRMGVHPMTRETVYRTVQQPENTYFNERFDPSRYPGMFVEAPF